MKVSQKIHLGLALRPLTPAPPDPPRLRPAFPPPPPPPPKGFPPFRIHPEPPPVPPPPGLPLIPVRPDPFAPALLTDPFEPDLPFHHRRLQPVHATEHGAAHASRARARKSAKSPALHPIAFESHPLQRHPRPGIHTNPAPAPRPPPPAPSESSPRSHPSAIVTSPNSTSPRATQKTRLLPPPLIVRRCSRTRAAALRVIVGSGRISPIIPRTVSKIDQRRARRPPACPEEAPEPRPTPGPVGSVVARQQSPTRPAPHLLARLQQFKPPRIKLRPRSQFARHHHLQPATTRAHPDRDLDLSANLGEFDAANSHPAGSRRFERPMEVRTSSSPQDATVDHRFVHQPCETIAHRLRTQHGDRNGTSASSTPTNAPSTYVLTRASAPVSAHEDEVDPPIEGRGRLDLRRSARTAVLNLVSRPPGARCSTGRSNGSIKASSRTACALDIPSQQVSPSVAGPVNGSTTSDSIR